MTKQLRIVEKAENLDALLFSAIDETLRHVFKEEGLKVIYDYIENKCNLKLKEIAEKPENFSDGLERLLISAATVIERMILKNLYEKLGLKFEEKEGHGFSDYIRELRRNANAEG